VANKKHGLCQLSGKGKADQLRTKLSDDGLSDWTYKMDDANIKRVMARVQEYLPLIKKDVEEFKKMGTLPELCRPAHAQQSVDEIAKKPALQKEALQKELERQTPPTTPPTTNVIDPTTSDSSTGSGSDEVDPVEPAVSPEISEVSPVTSEESEVEEPEQSDDPFQEVYEYVRDSVLAGASQKSKNILKESSVARDRAITVIAAGLKNAVIDASSGSREASEALGYGFDDAVARAVNELVEGM